MKDLAAYTKSKENLPGRPKKYNFDKILPKICEEYVNGMRSIKDVLKDCGGPSFSHFYFVVFGNTEYREMWTTAEKAKAAAMDAQFDEINKAAWVAFDNKDKNVNALKVISDNIKTRRGHLHSKFRDREVKHTHEMGESWRETMTKGRVRRKKAAALTLNEEGKVIEPDSQ